MRRPKPIPMRRGIGVDELAPTIAYTTSRGALPSGVAPLGVVFSAVGTTSPAATYPFHECLYSWNFGEPTLGNWTHSGKSKNLDTGPIAAHVFETPGNYTVTLTVKDTAGRTSIRTINVTVTDPATVFGDANTYLFSNDGDFTGAPAYATSPSHRITTNSWLTIQSYMTAARQLLLKRGDTFSFSTATSKITADGPGIVGAFGTGDAPVIANTGTAQFFQLGSYNAVTDSADDWRIMDLYFDGNGTSGQVALKYQGHADNTLLLRINAVDCCGIDSADDIINWSNVNGYPGQSMYSGLVYQEVTLSPCYSNAFYGSMYYGAILGCTFGPLAGGEHVIRQMHTQQSVTAHTKAIHANSTAVSGKHVYNLRNNDWEQMIENTTTHVFYPSITWHLYTEYVCIHDNIFEEDNQYTAWLCIFSPNSDGHDGRIRHVIFENNSLLSIPATDVDLYCFADSFITVRNNIHRVVGTAAETKVFVICKRRSDAIYPVVTPAPDPDHVWVYNNSYYTATSGAVYMVQLYPGTTDDRIRNNVCIAPNRSALYVVALMQTGAGITYEESNNLGQQADPGWSTFPPTDEAHFALTVGSACRDAGLAVPVFKDFAGTDRDYSGTPDQGAREYS